MIERQSQRRRKRPRWLLTAVFMLKWTLLIFSTCLFTGCSAEWYERSADSQVQQLVREREARSLAYKPQVEAARTVPTQTTPTAYSKVPATPVPPTSASPITPATQPSAPFDRLGPAMLLPSGVTSPESTVLDEPISTENPELRLGPPLPQLPVVRLDLFRSIAFGVQHSREYSSQMEDLYLQALDVTLQRHLFEPRPFARTGLHYAGGQEDVNYQSAWRVTNTVGVKQQLPYGGEIAAQGLVDFVNAINGNVADSEPASLALSASIPLLRGAGMVNLEPLINSERQMVYQVRTFENFRRTFAVNLASAYFQLLAQQQNIENNRHNVESLRALTVQTRETFKAGKLNFIEVQRALQQQLQGENDLVNAQSAYQRAVDDFKLLIGMPIDQPLEIVAQDLNVTVPPMDNELAVKFAREFRLDLRTAQDQIEDAQRNVRNSKNGLLPDLNLVANARVGNSPGAPASHLNNETSTYEAGIDLDLPIDRVAERNVYRRSLIQLERAQRAYDRLNDEVAADARQALRQIRQARITLQIQQKGIELAQLRVENARILLRLGRGDARNVVEAQASLLLAQQSYSSAKANLQIQVLRFLRDTGTLRVDPDAGSIGEAMERHPRQTALGSNETSIRPVGQMTE